MSRTVALLGTGVGGLTAAATLRDPLPATDRIVLVDRSFTDVLGLSLPWVLRGWRTRSRSPCSPPKPKPR
ncbi:hypothetical protein FOH10_10050 [Nocardia otitidiscaviarum]|uniref:Uncharacterized protein n=1 Tax=Nocardia otitidiscaviarum TaxID=1823 RepID=A0A516NJD5_9NOCA|nr:hypothetical protein [Nocardia otitidiscaviarum]MCP9618888.1 hypothetical protein [Nocardia otitidiscaviarum]QDP79024.1 hypothetical protein FOH10_10050 [Nocardia otitidiscaviarum]